MDQIYIRFDRLCNTNTLFQIISALKKFRTAHTEFDWETRSYCFTDSFQNFNSETTAVFQASTVFVCTLVKVRGKKLIDQPAVTTVDHDHLETGTFGKCCCFSIRCNNILEHFFSKGFYRYTVRTDCITSSPLMHGMLTGFIGHISSCVHSGMRKFKAWNCPMSGNRICCIGCGCKRIQDGSIQMICMRTICFGVYHTFADCYGSSTALATQFIESC